MVYVRIEIWPGGDKTQARVLQEATIANVGGDETWGVYDVVLSHNTGFSGRAKGFEDPTQPKAEEVWKRGRVPQFLRRLSPANLVWAGFRAAMRGS